MNGMMPGDQFVLEVNGRKVLTATASDIPGLFEVPGHGELTGNQLRNLAERLYFSKAPLTNSAASQE